MAGQEASAERAVAVELVLRCRACDAVVPINRLTMSAACPACGRRVELPEATWGLVLAEARESAGAAVGDERAAIVETGPATLRCVFRRTPAHCLACREPLPIGDPALHAGPGVVHCVGCGDRVAVRRAPVAAPGLDLVLGEEPEPAAPGAGAKDTRTVPCGACGAPLPLEGTHRTLTCTFCNASSAVPEDLWRELHPRREVRRWFLVFSPGTTAARGTATWTSINDAVIDAAGNVYCVGLLDPGDAETALFSIAPDMTLRWAKRSLAGLPRSRARLFVAPGGRIGAWYPGGHVIAFFDAATGDTVSTYPSAAAPRPAVPLERLVDLVADVDGTFLALVAGEPFPGRPEHCWFARFTEAGERRDLWPGVPWTGDLELGVVIESYRTLSSQPLALQGIARLAVTPTGMLFVYGGASSVFGWVRIARDGFVTREQVPVDSSMRLAGDANGGIHLLRRGELVMADRVGRLVWKLSAEGGGPAGLVDERHLVVLPSGEATLLGDGGRLRRVGPDGAVLFASPASRHADQERVPHA
jgi:hypothetical protein